MPSKSYHFSTIIWLYPGKTAWHFITLPSEMAKDIDFMFEHAKKGWGSLPVTVIIGSTNWTTSIFPDKKAASYLLPLKASVRKKEQLQAGDEVVITLRISA